MPRFYRSCILVTRLAGSDGVICHSSRARTRRFGEGREIWKSGWLPGTSETAPCP